MGAMRSGQTFEGDSVLNKRSIELSYYRGATQLSPTIQSLTLDLFYAINEKNSLQMQLPFKWVKGNLGKTSGLGDISVCYTRNILKSENFDFNASLGLRIPANPSDLNNSYIEYTTDLQSHILPMYYQRSLGSFDLIFGSAFISHFWVLGVGLQIPFNDNKNDFRYEDWKNYPNDEYIHRYDEANFLNRGTDLMFWIERAIYVSRFDFRLGLLPIVRISKDNILDVNLDSESFNQRIKVDGSSGMALTGYVSAAYQLSKSCRFKMFFGYAFKNRDTNPDGMDRENILTVSYRRSF